MSMDPKTFRSKMGGVIAFPVTPFKADLSLDLTGLRRNLQVLMKHPLCAVVAAGGTGELYSLTPAEHLEVVRATVEEVQGACPVIAGVGYNRAIGMELAAASAAVGADAILALPPYYPNADDEALLDYYASIGKATPLGFLVYSRDWVNPSAAWVEKLATAVPNLVAWKDGQGDTRRYAQIMQRLGDRLHWIGGVGDDNVPAYYSIGIRTYTSSIATVSPRLSIELHEVASRGDSAALRKLMDQFVTPLYAFRARRKGYEVSVMKEMMMLIGLAAGPVRPPLANVRKEELTELKTMLEGWKPWL
ncbi:MAG TPA: dihydrodipicolinate synthase family protein [Planctomycetota bacterium]|nr:dihydrodipicolinate synthase family protein [Planctomycetota bacterium]